MANKLRRMLCPTPEQQLEDYFFLVDIHNELKVKKGCSTCKHCIHVRDYPGFCTAEECECDIGLECDTVLFTIKNCPKWEEKVIEPWEEIKGLLKAERR